MTAEHYAMPFGAVSSVYAWDRIGEMIAKIASELLKTAACRWSTLLFSKQKKRRRRERGKVDTPKLQHNNISNTYAGPFKRLYRAL